MTAAPHRQAGQSLNEKLLDHLYDGVLFPVLLSLIFVIVAMIEWIHYFLGTSPDKWVSLFAALACCAWACWKVRGALGIAKQLRLGREGERAVGQFLERFRAEGFHIFHDVVTNDANIDHVLVGSRGIYTIETKTLSKPVRGECRIVANSEGVKVNRILMDRNPVIQAKAQAAWLKHFFGDVGFKVAVQPVVVFPGWFVEPTDFEALGAWVLEPKALPAFIERRSNQIAESDARALALALSSYIRSQAKL